MALSKADIVKAILKQKSLVPSQDTAECFAPSNIALVKYWGKKNQTLNLPVTSSLSVSLGDKGATTRICLSEQDTFILNGKMLDPDTDFSKRLKKFLDLFRARNIFYQVETQSNIPIAAGLASSAAGFAALVKALNSFYGWHLNETELSILSRLGSGSACRSIWNGFVEWQIGTREDGMDSHGLPLKQQFPDLCIGLLIFSENKKSIGSTEAMQRTLETSKLYQNWPGQVEMDLSQIKKAITNQDFELLGKTAEHNALSMHATMLSRAEGLPVYFTQDAGPNLKLIFLKSQLSQIQASFPQAQVIELFNAQALI
jgi:diphosphomevalonate decarboxylase